LSIVDFPLFTHILLKKKNLDADERRSSLIFYF